MVIVGGGIAGLTTAYELVKAGKKIALLEAHQLGGGATAMTTAFVTYVIDTPLPELSSRFGQSKAALVWESGRTAIDELERIIKTESIDCDFMRCPANIYAADEKGFEQLKNTEALAKKLGFDAALNTAPLGFSTPGYLRVENQGKFSPLKYLQGLAARITDLGGAIFENTKVISYTRGTDCVVKTVDGEIHAKQIVLATHCPIGDPQMISLRIQANQSYALEAKIPSNSLPEGLYWDTLKPYHYFRIDRFPAFDRMILGGEDHATGHSADTTAHTARLESYLHDLLPAEKPEIIRTWSGEVLETIDGLPYIGQMGKNRFVCTGFSGNGMTYGVLSAMIIRDQILGQTNPFTMLYRTNRLTGFTRLLGRFYAISKSLLKARLQKSSTMLETIAPDDGAIVTVNGKQIAAYRSADGKLIQLSPICTHLGCTVGWNAAAKTWDCPCHGSRYKKDGEVLNGPAQKPLQKIS